MAKKSKQERKKDKFQKSDESMEIPQQPLPYRREERENVNMKKR